MRRRTFMQTLPLAAAGSAVSVQGKATGQGQSRAAESTAADLPKFQPAGAETFHSARCSRGGSARRRQLCLAIGCAGFERSGRHRTSAGDADCHRDAQARRLCCGCGRGRQRRARIRRTGQLRLGRRLFCVRLGSEGRQARRHGQLGPVAQIALACNCPFARGERAHSGLGRSQRFNSRRARRLVDAAPALRKAEVG